ncbi:fibronectin type III domain-containing protein [Pseudoalteromonas sp. DL2-H2.2]|uniref:fibronectin type III domain-containing protein n=1 Tax=Pseudoalteromonas sp. DL2-H2.2 TaxID=2908889 RepID=UPI001F397BDD|nr:fibronectin type III domain-containing protein [Pseudoalteromonas sp. DL2-H2.2]MCF2910375.1 fibronectin type III domain-containing protein [Pseudoalteromonas sp. DL2-H2.2]
MRACNSEHNCSSWSGASNWISTPLPIPATPANVSVLMGAQKVTLSWGTASGASYYQLQYRDGNGGWGTSNFKYYGGSHVWENPTEILNNRNYRMRSCNSENGCSSWSSPSNWVSTPTPNAPNKPDAQLTGKDILVTWNKVDWATNYKIQVQWSHAEFSDVENYESTTNQIAWQDAYPGARIYSVQACNAVGCSSLSVPSEEIRIVSIPGRPSKPQASAHGNRIQVSWGSSYGATYYDLSIKYESNDWTEPGRYEYTGTSISWSDLESGTRRYKVRACNSAGCSDYSEVSSPLMNYIQAPQAQLTANNGVEVVWNTPLVGKFDIQIKYNGKDWTTPGNYTSNDTSIRWENLPSGERSYKVRACDDNLANCGAWSGESNKVLIPVWIHNVQVTGSTSTLEWGAVPNADYYDILIKYNDNDWTEPGRYIIHADSVTWSNLEGGQRSYKIRSCEGNVGSAICSAWSAPTAQYLTEGLPEDTSKLEVGVAKRTFINKSEQITWEFVSQPSTPLMTTLFVLAPEQRNMVELASSANGTKGTYEFVFEQPGRYKFFAQACRVVNGLKASCTNRWLTETLVDVMDIEFSPEIKNQHLVWSLVPGAMHFVIEDATCERTCDMPSLSWSTLVTLDGSHDKHDISKSEGNAYRIKVCFSESVCTSWTYVENTVPQKRVIFIHTDLLGNPIAETTQP